MNDSELSELVYTSNKLWAIKGLEMSQMDNYTTQRVLGDSRG